MMKRFLAIFLVMAMLFGFPYTAVQAEEPMEHIHIAYAYYYRNELFGWAEMIDGVYFARVTFFLSNSTWFVLIIPVDKDGSFSLDIAVNCELIVIAIVDSPMALDPTQGIFYDAKTVEICQ